MRTKTFTLTILAIFLIIVTARTFGQNFSLGAKAGAGISYLSHFEKNGSDMKRMPNIMIHGGFIGNIRFTNLVSLQFEILYQQNGERYKFPDVFPDQSSTSRLYINYLTMPVLVEFGHSFGNFNIFGGIGPYVGYALDGKVVSGDHKTNIKFGSNEFRRFDAGVSVDMGAGVKAGPGNIFLDMRYNFGFMDVMQFKSKPEGYKPHCNRNFDISFGYMIPLGKHSN